MNISEFQYDNVENDAGRIYIRYKIEDSKKALDIYRKGKNETYIKKIKEALAKAGFELQIKNGYLTLFLDVEHLFNKNDINSSLLFTLKLAVYSILGSFLKELFLLFGLI